MNGELVTSKHFASVLSLYGQRKIKEARDVFFDALFSLEDQNLEASDNISPEVLGIPRYLLDQHPHWKLKDDDLIFVVRSNGFDDQDVLTIRTKLLPSATTCKVNSSVLMLCAKNRNEANTKGTCKIYVPRFLPISASANTVAKFEFEGDWFYGQVSKDNHYQGLGIYHSKQGGTFFGMFEQNKQHGTGVHLKASQTEVEEFVIYAGTFKHNRRHGNGYIKDSNGFIWKVTYENGKCTQREMIEQEVDMQAVSEAGKPPVINISPV